MRHEGEYELMKHTEDYEAAKKIHPVLGDERWLRFNLHRLPFRTQRGRNSQCGSIGSKKKNIVS
jgi:hypothetical protein